MKEPGGNMRTPSKGWVGAHLSARQASPATKRCIPILLAGILLLADRAAAQWVSVDPAFPVGSGPDYIVRTLAAQPDGRVLVGGLFTNISGVDRFYFARFNTNGSVDPSFAPQLKSDPTRIQPLSGGRILISGAFTNVNAVFRPGLARLLDDGSLDTNFVPPPVPNAGNQLYGMAAPSGAVFVTGSFTNLSGLPRNRVARLLDTGAVDPAFQSPFAPTNTVSLLAVQSDGKPIISGSFSNVAGWQVTNLVRLNLDGSVDLSFQSGLAPNQRIQRSVLQPDGRLVAAVSTVADYGISITYQSLVRLNTNGALDSAFNVTMEYPGFPFSGGVFTLALQPDGKILVGGTFLRINGTPRAKIARLQPDGTLDFCFDVALGAELLPFALAEDLDGNIIAGGVFSGLHGQSHPYLMRLLPPAGCVAGVIEMAVPALLAREDAPRVVVPIVRRGGADLEQTVTFTTRDGSAQSGADYDATSGTLHFAPGERSQVITVPLRRDDVVEGPETFEVTLNQAGGGATLGARTNTVVTLTDPSVGTAGAPDTNYLVQLDGPVQVILPLTNGGAVIGGTFTNVNGQRCPNLARLLADGSRDGGFARMERLDGDVRSLALDSQGRLLAAGYFQHVDGVWRPGLARFGSDGLLDSGFSPFDSWPTNSYGGVEMEAVAVLADGSIVCGGWVPFGSYSSQDVLLKLSVTGQVDAAFTNHMPPSVNAATLTALPDGDFFVSGVGLGSSLVRLHADGTINFGFIPPADRQFAYYSGGVSPLPDGRVAVAGSASLNYGLPSQPPLWRLNPDGSLDTGFSLPTAFGQLGQLYSVDRLSIAADARALIAGDFSTGASSPALARLHADGSLDSSFDAGTGIKPRPPNTYSYVNALVGLPTGGWLMGGDFGGYDGFTQRCLVKILPETLTRPLTFQFTVTNVTVWETNALLTLEVQRHGDASGSASVTVRTEDGTAVGGQDFNPLDVRFDFAPGEWSKTVTVNILDDQLMEAIEQFTVRLTNATGGFGFAQPSAVTVRVQSDDAGVEFIADQFNGVEENGYVLAAVKWSGALSTGLEVLVNIVPVTGHGEDLGVSSVLVPYKTYPGLGTNWFRIPIVDDAQHETTRQFRLELVGSANLVPGPRTNASLLIDDLDFTASPARGVAGVVETMANAPGGGVYLAGDFTGVHGVPVNRVARLLPDGEVDTSFNPGAGPNSNVTAVAVQPDGRVVIAGDFSEVRGTPRAGVARLLTNGSLDLSFDPGLGPRYTNGTPFIRVLLPRDDGSLLVAGAFTHFDNHASLLLARLQPNGSVDSVFVSPFASGGLTWPPWPRPLPGASSAVYALIAQPSGKLLVGGALPLSVSPGSASVVRLNPNGQLDPTFTKITTATISFASSLALSLDGKILVGDSGQYDPNPFPRPPLYNTNWIAIRRFATNGVADASFQIHNAPQISFDSSQIRQVLVQPDGRILFSAAIYTRTQLGSFLDRAAIGRLLPDGTWDNTFELLVCALPLLQKPGPFWFNDPSVVIYLPPYPPRIDDSTRPVPTVTLARQSDGVLVLAGIFDFVNGEPRRRLARLEPDGTLRGRLELNLSGDGPLRLFAPGEVETPYVIETSTDLHHWSGWLINNYPWWPMELWLPSHEPARFFRARPTQ